MTEKELMEKRPLVVACGDWRLNDQLIQNCVEAATGVPLLPYQHRVLGGGLGLGGWFPRESCERESDLLRIRRAVEKFNAGFIVLTAHGGWCYEVADMGLYPQSLRQDNIGHSCHPELE